MTPVTASNPLTSGDQTIRRGIDVDQSTLSGWIRTCIRHFSAILFLQSRIVANRWSRESFLGKVIVFIFYSAISMGTVFAVILGAIAGYALYRNADSVVYASYVWNGLVVIFLVFWIVEISTELTRSDGVSMDRIMHLPISPSHVFSLNYILSLGNLPFIYFTCISIGLILGGSMAHGPSVLLIAIPVLAYLMMITALTSHLRSILSAWVANPKRRRLVMVMLPFVVGITMAGLGLSVSKFTAYIGRITKPNTHSVLPPTPTVLPDSTLPPNAPPVPLDGIIEVPQDSPEEVAGAVTENPSTAEPSTAEPSTAEPSTAEPNSEIPQETAPRPAKIIELARLLDTTLGWIDVTVPPLWFAACAESIPKSPWKSLWLVPSMLLIAALSLRRNYATTLRFYQHGFGSDLGLSRPVGDAVAPTVSSSAATHADSAAGPLEKSEETIAWMERTFPMLDETLSAIVAQTWISIWRAPEMKLQLMGPFIQPIILLFIMGYWKPSANPFLDTVIALGIAGFCLYASSGFLGNLFGFDRSGFRAWVMSPIPRHRILIGRNIAFGIPAFAVAALTCIGIGIYWRIPLDKHIFSLLALRPFIPVYFLVTNLQSILAPFGLPAGGIQPKRFNWKTVAMTLLLSTLIPTMFCVSIAPLGIEFVVSHFFPAMAPIPLAFILGIPWAFGSWCLYRALIVPLGKLLQHFQLSILEVVTSEVE